MISLKGNNVCLRALEPEDADVLYNWENNPDVWSVSDTLAPYSLDIIHKFIENQQYDIYQTRQMRLVISRISDSVPVGLVDLFDFDPVNQRAAVGILICEEENRRKGYASEALDMFITYASDVLKLHQLYCNINSGNLSSIELFCGKKFAKVGVKREWTRSKNGWYDEILFQRILF